MPLFNRAAAAAISACKSAGRGLFSPRKARSAKYCGCRACTERAEYGYESCQSPYTDVSLTGRTCTTQNPHLAASRAVGMRSRNSPPPTESLVRRLKTGMATPAPRQRCARRKYPSSLTISTGGGGSDGCSASTTTCSVFFPGILLILPLPICAWARSGASSEEEEGEGKVEEGAFFEATTAAALVTALVATDRDEREEGGGGGGGET
mmetsp:Transcript_3552/g.6099  ORF Transcript_3552/g.6099 Transcript_3552/m.6099 type:complete len:208 (-) Transcript_3552:7-630(-)